LTLDTRKTFLLDSEAAAVDLAEWLLGSVWGGTHYDVRNRSDEHGGETYTFIAPRAIHSEADVDTPAVLRAAEVAAAVDVASSMRSIAMSVAQIVDDVLFERHARRDEEGDVPPDFARGRGEEVYPALKRLLIDGDWEGAANDGDALEVAWRMLKIIEGSAPPPAPDDDMEARMGWGGDKPVMVS